MLPVRKIVFHSIIVLLSFIFSLSIAAQPSGSLAVSPVITRITLNNDSIINLPGLSGYQGEGKSKELIFSFRENNVGFTAEPDSGFEFRFQLSGFDKNPTQWQRRGFKEYTSLPAGHYTFHAWYRSPGSQGKGFVTLPFVIRPLWYFSKLSLLLYLMFVLLLVWVIYDQSGFALRPEAICAGTDNK